MHYSPVFLIGQNSTLTFGEMRRRPVLNERGSLYSEIHSGVLAASEREELRFVLSQSRYYTSPFDGANILATFPRRIVPVRRYDRDRKLQCVLQINHSLLKQRNHHHARTAVNFFITIILILILCFRADSWRQRQTGCLLCRTRLPSSTNEGTVLLKHGWRYPTIRFLP
jgi:hypothetical protein